MTHNGHAPDVGALQAGPLRLVPGTHPRIWDIVWVPDDRLRIARSVFGSIRATVGAHPAETGGMLGGSRLDGVVRRFEFDDAAAVTTGTYSPRHEALTALLREDWNPQGDQLLGFVHSHPSGFRRPSGPDIAYAARFLECNAGLDEMLVPIVTSAADNDEFAVAGFVVRRGDSTPRARPLEIDIVPDTNPDQRDVPEEFERVRDAYDLVRMARTRLVVVGAGGAGQFVEDLCRAGLGEVVLVDPDLVEARNVATQQAYLADVGQPKVEALARRLVLVSPSVVVAAVHASSDVLSDQDFERLATARIAARPRPEVTLLCGFTDDFWAQARVARLALNLGLPSLAAQVYAEGRGAEVSFALAGLTPACQRCVLRSRYRAYLQDGYRNEIGSDGTPIFATARLNALKGFVALALIHGAGAQPAQGPAARRWLRLLARIGNRNLIMIRLDPDLADSLHLPVFDRVFGGADQARIVADETVWLPQQPQSAATGRDACGDCGGTGSLLDAVGTIADSRLARVGAR